MCELLNADNVEIKPLQPKVIFGFDGDVNFGLQMHPDGKHVVFPVGSKVIVTDIATCEQDFIVGHTNTISCLDISVSGSLLATGQKNQRGFQSYVILWDWATKTEVARHDLHKGRVQSLCFTAEDKYLVSIGGRDDGAVIVYDIETHTPICRSIAAKSTAGIPFRVIPLNNRNSFFIIAGDRHLRIWSIRRDAKKLAVHDVCVGKQQRQYTSMRVDACDEFLYLGTMTGDVVKVRLNCCDPINVTELGKMAVLIGSYGKHNPRKPKGKDCEKYVNGVRDLWIIQDHKLLIGAGDGTVELVAERNISFKDYDNPTWPMFETLKRTKVNGAVTSFTRITKDNFLIGTDSSEIYILNSKTFDMKLLKTCHKKTVFSIAFPKNFSLVFATASYDSIRIWSTRKLQELLRIMVWNFKCSSIEFTHDGMSLISAWNDGVIRSFTPITGRLIYAIPNAHNKGVSAVTISSNGKVLVSGGVEGQVRVWKIEPIRQSLIGVLKEHSAPIATIDFNKFDTEVVSASSDGSCVIWDVSRLTRKRVFYANTQFMCARYFPTGVQILTAGSDRRISYWEVYDGTLVRELVGSPKASINCISICSNGEYFVSVGNDQLINLWDYQKGTILCCGSAHAAPVVSCQYSPCGKFFVTGSADGAVMVWDIPEEFWPKERPLNTETKKRYVPITESKIDTGRSGSSKSSGKKEHVLELETCRTNKDLFCAECPPVDCKCKPDINDACIREVEKKNS